MVPKYVNWRRSWSRSDVVVVMLCFSAMLPEIAGFSSMVFKWPLTGNRATRFSKIGSRRRRNWTWAPGNGGLEHAVG